MKDLHFSEGQGEEVYVGKDQEGRKEGGEAVIRLGENSLID